MNKLFYVVKFGVAFFAIDALVTAAIVFLWQLFNS